MKLQKKQTNFVTKTAKKNAVYVSDILLQKNGDAFVVVRHWEGAHTVLVLRIDKN